MILPVMNTAHAAAMDRFLPSLSETVPAMSPPAAATKLSDETITPCDQTESKKQGREDKAMWNSSQKQY